MEIVVEERAPDVFQTSRQAAHTDKPHRGAEKSPGQSSAHRGCRGDACSLRTHSPLSWDSHLFHSRVVSDAQRGNNYRTDKTDKKENLLANPSHRTGGDLDCALSRPLVFSLLHLSAFPVQILPYNKSRLPELDGVFAQRGRVSDLPQQTRHHELSHRKHQETELPCLLC